MMRAGGFAAMTILLLGPVACGSRAGNEGPPIEECAVVPGARIAELRIEENGLPGIDFDSDSFGPEEFGDLWLTLSLVFQTAVTADEGEVVYPTSIADAGPVKCLAAFGDPPEDGYAFSAFPLVGHGYAVRTSSGEVGFVVRRELAGSELPIAGYELEWIRLSETS